MAGIGNNGNVGKKGRSGRKSAQYEHKIAKIIEEAFEVGVDVDALESIAARLRSKGPKGKVRLIDIALHKAVKGDRTLDTMLSKLMPDKILDETPSEESPASKIISAIFTKPKKTAKKKPKKKPNKKT